MASNVNDPVLAAGDQQFTLKVAEVAKLTNWAKEPSVQDLKNDLAAGDSTHQARMNKVNRWRDLMKVEGAAKPVKVKGRSSVQPKLIRRQAEWRYSALTEPFLSSNRLFKVTPTTFEDEFAAKQAELLLNWQIRTKFNKVKLIDDMVRADVDEGSCIVRVGWKRVTKKVKETVPTFSHFAITEQEGIDLFNQALEMRKANPRAYEEGAPPELKAALDYYDENQEMTTAQQSGTAEVEVEKIEWNQPTADVLNPANVIIDPSCNGSLDEALYAVIKFETNYNDLKKQGSRYKNLDQVLWENNSAANTPDYATNTPGDYNLGDKHRRKVVAHEYWGYRDLGSGFLEPFVATWIGNIMIRMERNPYPDQKIPVVVIPYMPLKRELHGEPDAELLEDNQAILGAVNRGLIDLMGRSANAQQGMAKGMLDVVNKRKFERGEDYEFNPGQNPQANLIQHQFPEIPQSALTMVQMQNGEAEALTGVKSFGGGLSGESYGDVAANTRGVLDAASKREMAILRRLAWGICEIGKKFASMNQEFLSEREVVRVTNREYVEVMREDLAGNYDLEVDIATAEIDDAKAKDLGFMLQTIGPNMPPEISNMLLAEIADLKRMPGLAEKLRNYKPTPDPIQEQIKQLELQKLQMEIEELRSKAELNDAKADEASATTDQKNLDFVEQEGGTKHARDMELQKGQSEGNQNLAITKALATPKKEGEKPADLDAAIGFTQLSDKLNGAGTRSPVVASANQRDMLAGSTPALSLGSGKFDPAMDPSLNPAISI